MKLPRWFWIAAFLVCWPTLLFAQPIFSAETGDVRILLTDEPCELKAVANLPYKATWTEKGKEFSGCWAPRPNEGVVIGYFSDLTVALIPIQVFKKVVGI